MAGSGAPGHFRSRLPRLQPLPVLLVVALLGRAPAIILPTWVVAALVAA